MASDEEEIRRGWLAAARAWTAGVSPRVLGPWRQARVTPDPVWVLSTQGVWVQHVQENVTPGILGALRSGWRSVTGSTAPSLDQQQYVTDYLQQAVNRMANTPEQVYREISDQIGQGVAAGESIDQLAARVQAVFDVTGNPFWENRATVVARTEAQSAVNAGALAGAGQQEIDTGRRMVKVWQATVSQPTRTRPAHLAADGQAVPLQAPFMVGGEPLQFPGDPKGSAGNVIQCRCDLTFREA